MAVFDKAAQHSPTVRPVKAARLCMETFQIGFLFLQH